MPSREEILKEKIAEIISLRSQGRKTSAQYYELDKLGYRRSEISREFYKQITQPGVRTRYESGGEILAKAREQGYGSNVKEYVAVTNKQIDKANSKPQPKYVDEYGQGVSVAPEALRRRQTYINEVASKQQSIDPKEARKQSFNEAIKSSIERTPQPTGIVKSKVGSFLVGATQAEIKITETAFGYVSNFGYRTGKKKDIDFGEISPTVKKIKGLSLNPKYQTYGKAFTYSANVFPALVSLSKNFLQRFTFKKGVTKEGKQYTYLGVVKNIKGQTLGEILSPLSVVNIRSGVYLNKNPIRSGSYELELPKTESLKPLGKDYEVFVSSRKVVEVNTYDYISVRPTIFGGYKLTKGKIKVGSLKDIKAQGLSFSDNKGIGFREIKGVEQRISIKNYKPLTESYYSSYKEYLRFDSKVNLPTSKFIKGNKFSKFYDVPSSNEFLKITTNVEVFTPLKMKTNIKVKGLNKYTEKIESVSKLIDPLDTKMFSFGGNVIKDKAIIYPSFSLSKLGKKRVFSINKKILQGRELGDDKIYPSPRLEIDLPKDSLSFGKNPFSKLDFSNSELNQNLYGAFSLTDNRFKSTQNIKGSYNRLELQGRFRSLSSTKDIQQNKIIQSTSSIQKTLIITSPVSRSNQVTRQQGLTIQSTSSIQKTLTKQNTKLLSLNLNVFPPINIITSPPKSQPPILVIPLFKKSKNVLPKLNISVQVRRRGKFKTIGTTSDFNKAINLGRNYTEKTLARSFRLKGINKFVVPLGYRKSKRDRNVIVELSKKAINTPGEIIELRTNRRR